MRYQKDSQETKELIESFTNNGLNDTLKTLKIVAFSFDSTVTYLFEDGLKMRIYSSIFSHEESKLIYQIENESDDVLWRKWFSTEEEYETVLITYPNNDYYKWEVRIGEEYDETGDIEWTVYPKGENYSILDGYVNHKTNSYGVEIVDGFHIYVGKTGWSFENLQDFLYPELRKLFKQD